MVVTNSGWEVTGWPGGVRERGDSGGARQRRPARPEPIAGPNRKEEATTDRINHTTRFVARRAALVRGWPRLALRLMLRQRDGVHSWVSEGAWVCWRPRSPSEASEWRGNLATRSIQSLIRRLRQAGFGRDFVSGAILPDWWDPSCLNQPELLPEIEIRAGRFLAVPLSTVRDPESTLEPPRYPQARLRCARDIDRDRLAPAIHAAMRIASAVVRNLKEPVPAPACPPSDGLAWRQQIRGLGGRSVLDAILEDLWTRGIPVVPTHLLPTPGFQGLAAVVANRPVVVLGHRHDELSRVAFRIAHEVGHIAKGDCAPDAPVIDEDEEILEDSGMEALADEYAVRALAGEAAIPKPNPSALGNYRALATATAALSQKTGVDAGSIIFSWVRTTGDYAMATRATKALYLATGASRILRQYFNRFVDVGSASLSDQELMRVIVHSSPLSADASSR